MSSAANHRVTADFEKLFQQALAYRNAAEYERALDILLKLRRRRPTSASVHGILADVYWRMHCLQQAVFSFQRAAELAPTSELASLGLYHTLKESGQPEKARAEMQRFLSLSHSDEYALLSSGSPRRHRVERRRRTQASERSAKK
jgi:tetratricopeptide (TPR) repeat protein